MRLSSEQASMLARFLEVVRPDADLMIVAVESKGTPHDWSTTASSTTDKKEVMLAVVAQVMSATAGEYAKCSCESCKFHTELLQATLGQLCSVDLGQVH